MLKNINIHNFKSIENLSLRFDSRVSEINGTEEEKTSTLDAIAILLSTLFKQLDGPNSISIRKSDSFIKDSQSQFPISLEAEADLFNESILWKLENKSEKSSTSYKNAKDMISLSDEVRQRIMHGDTSMILPIFAYYGKDREWNFNKSTDCEMSSRTNGYKDCLSGKVKAKTISELLMKLTIRKYQNQEIGIESPVSELDACIRAINSGFRMLSGNDHCSIQYKLMANELVVLDENHTPVSQINQSDKMAIYLIADIACKMATLNPQLMDNVCELTEGVALIDNINYGLSEEYRDKIMNVLMSTFPKVQFIITKG